MRIVVVGGVAGGASAAARARRLSETAEIVLLERGPHVSFANCGLPYYIGGEITKQDDLLVQTPQGLQRRFNLDVRVNSEVTRIDRDAREVEAHNLTDGQTYRLGYDALILSPGASPLKPPIPGIERPGHFTLRNVPDTLAIDAWIRERDAMSAVVVGGGYIGLEMAEQLSRRGLSVTVVEMLDQVMAPVDPEIAAWLHKELQANGVEARLSDAVATFDTPGDGESAQASVVVLKSGARLPADVVVLGLGVRPETKLARDAGLEIGAAGGIRVDAHLRTSDHAIYAVGDAIEVRNRVTDEWMLLPLAGPANRQGRMAADNILGREQTYEGSWGTGVLRLFNLTVGMTGANEKTLRRVGVAYQAVHLHPFSHAGYYPGAQQMALKLLFAPDTGRILGAQAVGGEGVDKRIDVIATAMQAGLTVRDLAQLELAYAPPIGSAKDPVNLAGMVAENVLDGLMSMAQWDEVAHLGAALLLDVREPSEVKSGVLPGATHIPLGQLRERLSELPRDRDIVVYCRSGQRSYYAARVLALNGYNVRNLSGAWLTWNTAQQGSPIH